MGKGFASLVFLMVLAQLLVATQGVHAPTNPSIPDRALELRRTEIEHALDAIIRTGLHRGVVLHQPPQTIQSYINLEIGMYLDEVRASEGNPFTYELGFATLEQTNYLSLLASPLTPFTLEQLNAASHVLVLPISQTQEYGEYSYTGGAFGTHIFVLRIHAGEQRTLVALPSGYHACATTFQPNLPCVNGG